MSLRRLSLAVLFLSALVPEQGCADTIIITPSDSYQKIESAVAGDEVIIAPGTYKFRLNLTNSGTPGNPIVIRAQDPGNRPIWDLAGKNVNQWPGSYTGGDNDRGAWQIRGSHYLISDVVIKNATNGRNSAGLRYVGANNVTISNLLIQFSDNGITGDGENNIIEFTELDRNGLPNSSTHTHSIYLFGGSFTIRYSYIHDSTHGQNLHLRTRDCLIENSWIARANNYEGDIMAGPDKVQTLTLRGNVIVQDSNPENNSQLFVLYNDQSSNNARFQINMDYNTIIGNGGNAIVVNMRNDGLEFAGAELNNNIVYGLTNSFSTAPGNNWSFSGTNNWFSTGSNTAGLNNTVLGSDPGFMNPGAGNYTLLATGSAINQADPTAVAPPVREYYKDETSILQYRERASGNDQGAFESTTSGPASGPGGTGGGGGGDTVAPAAPTNLHHRK